MNHPEKIIDEVNIEIKKRRAMKKANLSKLVSKNSKI
jgi:hypothetical protein